MLEARGRVGGRVHTLYGGEDGVPFDRGLRAEVGGESIDDTHTALRNMLRRFGLATERRPGDTTSRAEQGLFRYRGHTYTFAALSALRGGTVLARLPAGRRRASSASPRSIGSIPSIPKRPTARRSSIA